MILVLFKIKHYLYYYIKFIHENCVLLSLTQMIRRNIIINRKFVRKLYSVNKRFRL